MIDLQELNWFFLSFPNSLHGEAPQNFQPFGPSQQDFTTLSAWKMNKALWTILIDFMRLKRNSQAGLAEVRSLDEKEAEI